MPPVLTHRQITENEFLRLPDDGRKYELVNGDVKDVPSGFEHDAIGANVSALLMPFTRGKGVLAGSQAGFRMANGNLRSPDVSYTRKERLTNGKPEKGFRNGAPDLCIEVISPSEDPAEMQQKVREYFDSGAEQVWHLYPEERRLRQFLSPIDSHLLEPEAELDASTLIPGFRIRVADLFDLGLE